MPSRRFTLRSLGAAAALAILPRAAMAAFPEHAVSIVFPFSSGGRTDLVVRALADGLHHALGYPCVVEHIPGAGSVMGSSYASKAEPDGYTLLLATFAYAVNPTLLAKLPYDSARAFLPVGMVGRSSNVLVVRSEGPFREMSDILASARSAPGRLTFASQGIGTTGHMAGELFANLGRVTITHVPYRGAASAMTNLMAGAVDMMFATLSVAMPLITGGRLRALGVTAPAPVAILPGVPTIATVLPGYALEGWYGLYAPAGTPAPVIARLNAAINSVIQTDAFRRQVRDAGMQITPGTPEALASFVEGESQRWGKIIAENKITPK